MGILLEWLNKPLPVEKDEIDTTYRNVIPKAVKIVAVVKGVHERYELNTDILLLFAEM